MGHKHEHGHNHELDASQVNMAFFIGIGLNIIFVIVEVVYGLLLNSSALLSDAGHNFSDVLSLIIGASAYLLVKVQPRRKFTYGLKKLTVLAAFVNSVLLLIAVGAIITHSFRRMLHPEPLDSVSIMIVAGVGIVINSLSAWLFYGSRKKDINIKAVFWHLVADALVSVGVVIGAFIIKLTNAYWIDGFIGVVISVIILISTWDLLRESFLMTIDVAPKDFDVEQIKRKLETHESVVSVHHVHLWAISTMLFSFTAHVVVRNNFNLRELEKIKKELKSMLAAEGIRHSTIEFESEDFQCEHEYEC